MKLNEISSADKAANPDARILLMKRDGAAMTPEDALKISIASGLADDAIADKAAWIAEQTKAYNDHVAKGVVTFKKGATNVDRNSENLMMFAKMAIDQGRSPGLNKSVFIAGITLRADAIRKAGESAAQAFTRAITADEFGQTPIARPRSRPGRKSSPRRSRGAETTFIHGPTWSCAHASPGGRSSEGQPAQVERGRLRACLWRPRERCAEGAMQSRTFRRDQQGDGRVIVIEASLDGRRR